MYIVYILNSITYVYVYTDLNVNKKKKSINRKSSSNI